MDNPYVHPELQKQFNDEFWKTQKEAVEKIDMKTLKFQDLPLARIKKIMKMDENVKMISAEVPILFSKAIEVFIGELTMRAWWCTEENRRRTIQKGDVALAASRFDQFDFLIDIIPREEIKALKRPYLNPPLFVLNQPPFNMSTPLMTNKNHLKYTIQNNPHINLPFNSQLNSSIKNINNSQPGESSKNSSLNNHTIMHSTSLSTGHSTQILAVNSFNNANQLDSYKPHVTLSNDKPILFQVTHQQLESLLGLNKSLNIPKNTSINENLQLNKTMSFPTTTTTM